MLALCTLVQRARASSPFQLLLLEEAAAAAVTLAPALQPVTGSTSSCAAGATGHPDAHADEEHELLLEENDPQPADASAQADAHATAAAAAAAAAAAVTAAAATALQPRAVPRCREAERQLPCNLMCLRGCNPCAQATVSLQSHLPGLSPYVPQERQLANWATLCALRAARVTTSGPHSCGLALKAEAACVGLHPLAPMELEHRACRVTGADLKAPIPHHLLPTFNFLQVDPRPRSATRGRVTRHGLRPSWRWRRAQRWQSQRPTFPQWRRRRRRL